MNMPQLWLKKKRTGVYTCVCACMCVCIKLGIKPRVCKANILPLSYIPNHVCKTHLHSLMKLKEMMKGRLDAEEGIWGIHACIHMCVCKTHLHILMKLKRMTKGRVGAGEGTWGIHACIHTYKHHYTDRKEWTYIVRKYLT